MSNEINFAFQTIDWSIVPRVEYTGEIGSAFWQTVLLPAIQAVWGWLSGTLFPFLRALSDFIGSVFSLVLTALAGIWQNVLQPALEKAHDVLAEKLQPAFTALGKFWTNTLEPIVHAMADWIGGSLVGAFDSLTSTLQTVTDWLSDVSDALDNMTLPDWMTPGSPTPWEIGLLGVNDALKKVGNIGLPSISGGMGALSAPAIAGNGGMVLGGAGGMSMVHFTYQPFIGVNDEYEAEQKLRGIMERVNRKSINQ